MAFNFYPSYQVVLDSAATVNTRDVDTKWPPGDEHDGGIDREEGHCPDCGVQTHRLDYRTANMTTSRGCQSSSAIIVHKEPLTVEKKVYQGRCLACDPLYGSSDVNDNCVVGYADGADQEQQQEVHQEPCPLQENSIGDNAIGNDYDEILDILSRMRLHPHDLQVQISCFHSLWVLSWETENARAIGRVGGIPILLESLRYHLKTHQDINNRYNRNNHTSSPSSVRQMQLQLNGLATLQNLSVIMYNAEVIVEQPWDGIPLVLLSMSSFLHNPEMVYSGCNTLANILSHFGGCCYNKHDILNNNGGLKELILKCVKMHDENEGVLQAAYKCLSLLGQKTLMSEFRSLGKGDIMTDGEGSSGSDGDNNVPNDYEGGGGDFLMDLDTSVRSAQSFFMEDER